MPKYAIYSIPQADDPFYQLGTHILGYDVRTRQMVDTSPDLEAVLGSDKETWVTVCRPYGFHLTICEALDCDWTTIPRVEQELADLLKCFDPLSPLLLERRADQPVGIWGEEAGKSLVLLYEPNTSLRVLHTLLVARLTPFGTGSNVLKRYLTHAEKDLPPYQAQQIRLFASPAVFDHWQPHFTLLNPYTGAETLAMASRLAQLFQAHRQVTVSTICLLIQENDEANWQIYREFRR